MQVKTKTKETVPDDPTQVKSSVKNALPAAVKQKTESEKIWEEIKHIQLNMFTLPDQTVEKYCSPINIEPNRLYITLTASSALVALEEAIGNKFEITSAGKYLTISRK